MSSTKPTIVFVCGSWHQAEHIKDLKAKLSSSGYDFHAVAQLSIVGPDPATKTMDDNVVDIRDHALQPLVDEGKEIILMLHSFGGLPGSAAAKGLSLTERAASGKTGGILGLILLCAFVIPFGIEQVPPIVDGKLPPSVSYDEATDECLPADPRRLLYNQAPAPAAEWAIKLLLPMYRVPIAFTTPDPCWTDSAWDGRRFYLVTTEDGILPPVAQTAMIAGTGVKWDVTERAWDHSPFLSHLEELSAWVVEKIGEIQKTYQ